MNFFPPVVCMNAFLLEPLFAQIWGYMYSLDAFPSFFTIAGYVAVTIAIYQYNTSIILKNTGGQKEIADEDDEEKL